MATFWLIRKANTWKKIRFSTFLNKLNLETFDCVLLSVGETYVADSDVKMLIESANYNSESHRIDFECWVPVKSGEMETYGLAWPASSELTFPTVQEIEDGFAGGDGVGANANGRLPVGKFEINSSTVWVGGVNVVFSGHSDWGDPHPGDIGFEAQTVVDTSLYANLSNIPAPDPPQNYTVDNNTKIFEVSDFDANIPRIDVPSGVTAIDIRKTRIVDSQNPSDVDGATLDSILYGITDSGMIKIKTSALFADEEHDEGAVFHFRYDTEHERYAAGSAFLL